MVIPRLQQNLGVRCLHASMEREFYVSSRFWDLEYLDLVDSLNEEIWARSRDVQNDIDPPLTLTHVGAIGAQQAMVPSPDASAPSVLPWVPDIVGKNWRTSQALHVVGAAYAGFIRELSGRGGCLPLAHYRDADSPRRFQQAFVSAVVGGDRDYYGPIADLCSQFVSPDSISTFDLCRVSLVQRAPGGLGRRDSSSSGDLRKRADVYSRYSETEPAASWLWRRIIESEASVILALGSIPEHGLLRLFARHGCSVRDANVHWRPKETPRWAMRYADPQRKLGYWLDSTRWWTIEGTVAGVVRSWHLVPVFHPAARTMDPGYARTRHLLNRVIANVA
jgi:hypothetical protein